MEPVANRPSLFVSYTQHDRSWAEWIAWVLEETLWAEMSPEAPGGGDGDLFNSNRG